MSAAEFAALFGTGTEDLAESSRTTIDNFFLSEEEDEDDGAEWD